MSHENIEAPGLGQSENRADLIINFFGFDEMTRL